MSGLASAPETPIQSKADLIAYFERAMRPPAAWRIGTEHEKFPFRLSDHRSLPYDDKNGGPSIKGLLQGLMQFGWQPIYEGENLIALSLDGQTVSLEPGGQFELSGAPLETIHDTCAEVNRHLTQVKAVGEALGVGMLGLGFNPLEARDDIPVMPKGRYAIMRGYMPTRGQMGLDMMLRTATVQVNLDFASEADMVQKLRIALALQPLAVALFASSPFAEGRPNGFLSLRGHVWTDVDPDRTGLLPFVFEDGMGFERYVDYALDVPMYFIYRDGRYLDVRGQSFRAFMAGRLPDHPGLTPTLRNWADHLTTIFTEARIKPYLEMRGADSGPWRRLCALPAFWTGLLYDDDARDAAWDLVKGWTAQDREALRRAAPRDGLRAATPIGSMQDLALRVLELSRAGLRRRARLNAMGEDESIFLEALMTIVKSGRTPADDLLALYRGPWAGDIHRVYQEFAY